MSTSTEQLCKVYAIEFRSYFAYCRSLRFLKIDLIMRTGRGFSKSSSIVRDFNLTIMFDWTVLNSHYNKNGQGRPPERPLISSNQQGGNGDPTSQKSILRMKTTRDVIHSCN